MNLKNSSIFKNILGLSKEEKTRKTIITYIITAISCSILLILNINFVISIVASLFCSFGYFLYAPTPKIKPKKEKKRSSLDEEYLKEYDEEINN